MSRIAEHDDFVRLSTFEKSSSVVGDMVINKKKALTAVRFLFCLLVKVLDPLHLNLTVYPAFF